MDTSRMSQGQMVAAVGGVVLIISLFLNWVPGGSAFDIFSGMDIILLIIGIVAVVWGAAAGMGASIPPVLSGMLVGLLGIAAVGFTFGGDIESDSADIGAWLALVGSIAIAWGALAGGRRPAAVSSRTAAPPPPSAPAA